MTWVTREVPPGSGRYRCVNEPKVPHPGAAPALNCSQCGRVMGKKRLHFLTRAGTVLCGRCYDALGEDGPDLLDCAGSRAAIAYLLGVWPRK
jgi:hypothetical protein